MPSLKLFIFLFPLLSIASSLDLLSFFQPHSTSQQLDKKCEEYEAANLARICFSCSELHQTLCRNQTWENFDDCMRDYCPICEVDTSDCGRRHQVTKTARFPNRRELSLENDIVLEVVGTFQATEILLQNNVVTPIDMVTRTENDADYSLSPGVIFADYLQPVDYGFKWKYASMESMDLKTGKCTFVHSVHWRYDGTPVDFDPFPTKPTAVTNAVVKLTQDDPRMKSYRDDAGSVTNKAERDLAECWWTDLPPERLTKAGVTVSKLKVYLQCTCVADYRADHPSIKTNWVWMQMYGDRDVATIYDNEYRIIAGIGGNGVSIAVLVFCLFLFNGMMCFL